ncbi:MAG: tetratricopeptide repeat protein [Rhodospirillaceae bacterium]
MTRASPPPIMDWLQKAVTYHQAGNLEPAERLYDKVLKVDRNNADALNLKGMIASTNGRHNHALSFFDRAAAARPTFADPHFNKGLALVALDRNEDALAAYARALSVRPDYADAHLNLGLTLHMMRRKEEAIAAFRAMTQVCPMDARGFYNLGACLEKILPATSAEKRDARAGESAAAFERALALNPGNPDIHYAYSNLHNFRGDYREAAAHLETALRLRPHWPDGWNNLANQVEALGDRKGALAMFERALEQDPNNTGAFVNRGMTCLALGRFTEGWQGYARRFDDPRFPFTPRNWPWPKWNGEDLNGKSILLWGDQGVGDEVLYSSMVPEVARRAGICVLECEPRLVPIYRRSFPSLEVVSVRKGLSGSVLAGRQFDFQCSVLDLGAQLRQSFAAFPIRPGILHADRDSSIRLRQKYLHARPENRLIGLSWRSINPGMTHQKSLALDAFAALFRLPNATFLNLQYGDVATDIAAAKAAQDVEILVDPDINPLIDLDGFADQVSACHAVVTVSNTTAHFAGALDVPTALYVPDARKRQWYWFDGGAHCPWYRSVRIFRTPGEAGMNAIYNSFI